MLEFINHHVKNEDELVSAVLKLSSDRLLLDALKEKNKKHYYMSLIEKCMHKKVMHIFSDEIKSLSQAFQQSNINIVHFKGSTLAHELYPSPEVRRFSDIDCMIRKRDLNKSLKILKQMGYQTANEEIMAGDISDEWLETNMHNMAHLPPFHKCIAFEGKEFTICLELHLRLTHTDDVDYSFHEKIIQRSVLKSSDGQDYRTLHIYDYICYLLYHFAHEFMRHGCDDMFYSGYKNEIKLPLLYDIELLIKKHISTIDWDEFIRVFHEWAERDMIRFALKLFMCVFPDTIPLSVANSIGAPEADNIKDYGVTGYTADTSSEKNYSIFYRKILPALYSQDPADIIFGDKRKIFSDCILAITKSRTINVYQKDANVSIVQNSSPTSLDEIISSSTRGFNIALGHNCFSNANVFGTHIKAQNACEENVSAYVTLSWDNDNLYVHSVVKGRVFKDDKILGVLGFMFGLGDSYVAERGMELSSFVRMLSCMVKKGDMDYYIDIWDSLKDHSRKYLHESDYLVATYPDGYTCDITFPWNYLGFTPEKGKKIFFDVYVFFPEQSTPEDKPEYRIKLQYSHLLDDGEGLDPSLMAVLKLC